MENQNENALPMRRDIGQMSDFGAPSLKSDTARCEPVYNCGDGDFALSYSGVTEEEFHAYIGALAADYRCCAENSIGENRFFTWCPNDVSRGDVFVEWYPAKGILKSVCAQRRWLPSATPAPFRSVTHTSFTQPGRCGAEQNAPGMSYLMQLADGRFVVVDGGPYDPKDADDLLELMKGLMPVTDGASCSDEKPTIAMWIFSHAHADHMALAIDFLRRYHEAVNLELVAYNFPDFSRILMSHEAPGGMLDMHLQFKETVEKYFPGAATWIFHTGQKLALANADFEILYTHEDYYPEDFAYGNDTSSAFRIKTEGKTLMMMGDCDPILCQFMADVYGRELKSDILQLSHHGFNGACMDLNQAIDPDICFWACDKTRFETDKRCLGTAHHYEFNFWLRDESVKHREHYHSTESHTVLLG